MNIIQKIRSILKNDSLDLADKICEINAALPKEQEFEISEVLGQVCKVTRTESAIIYDGSYGCEYTDNPRLKNDDDLYYCGGTTWGTDLDGKRFWKRYSPFITKDDRYRHLSYGDIINEKERIRKIVNEILTES